LHVSGQIFFALLFFLQIFASLGDFESHPQLSSLLNSGNKVNLQSSQVVFLGAAIVGVEEGAELSLESIQTNFLQLP